MNKNAPFIWSIFKTITEQIPEKIDNNKIYPVYLLGQQILMLKNVSNTLYKEEKRTWKT